MYSLLHNRTSRLHVYLFYKLIIKNITFCMYACIWYVTILQLSYSQKYTWRVTNMQLKNLNHCNNDLAINGKPFGYTLDLWCDLHVHQVSLYSFLNHGKHRFILLPRFNYGWDLIWGLLLTIIAKDRKNK